MSNRDLLIQEMESGKPNPRRIYDEDAFFKIRQQIEGRTLIDPARCHMIWQLAKMTKDLSGVAVEIGVYKGGSSKLISLAIEDKWLYSFDTFEGLPDANPEHDIHVKGDFQDCHYKDVTSYLTDSYRNIVVTKTRYPDGLSDMVLGESKVFFCHIDVDLYQETINCLEDLWPRMVIGAAVVIDDYGTLNCPGVTTAVDEFFSNKIEKPLYYNLGHCFAIKVRDG